MSYPVGVITRVVNFGPAFGIEDAADIEMRVVLKASRNMVWVATGAPAISTSIAAQSDEDGENSVALPVTDQEGWGDGRGNLLDVSGGKHTHSYTASVTYWRNNKQLSQVTVGPFVLPQGDDPVDIDNLLPVGGTGGSISIPDFWSDQVAAAAAAADAAEVSAAAAAQSVADVAEDISATVEVVVPPKMIDPDDPLGSELFDTYQGRFREGINYQIGMMVMNPYGEVVTPVDDFTSTSVYDPLDWESVNGSVDITDLGALAVLAVDDLFVVYDTSTGTAKKMTSSQIMDYFHVNSALDFGQICRPGFYIGRSGNVQQTQQLNTMYMWPLRVWKGGTLNQLRMHCQAASAASRMRVALWHNDPVTNWPLLANGLIAEFAPTVANELNTDTTGVKSLVINQAVADSSINWVATVAQGGTPAMYGPGQWFDRLVPANPGPSIVSNGLVVSDVVAGAIPASITSISGVTERAPSVLFKAL